MAEAPRNRGWRVRWAGVSVLTLALVAGLAFAVHWYRELRYLESTDDAYVSATLVLLSARVGGTVIDVPVEENQRVRAGQLLVRLDRSDYEVRVARARADLDAARNRMAAARAAAQAADADRRAATAERMRAEREAGRVHGLFERNAASQQDLDNAEAQRDAAAARVLASGQRAEAERAVLGNEAPVRQAQAALREAELALSYTSLVAPVDGVVGKKNVNAGENVSPGQPLLALANDEQPWVVANFKETQIGRMRPGDPAEIHVDAFPDRAWRGHVESFSPATGAQYALIPPDNATGNFTKVVQRLPVRISLDPTAGDGDEPDLPVGLSVEVQVRVDGR